MMVILLTYICVTRPLWVNLPGHSLRYIVLEDSSLPQMKRYWTITEYWDADGTDWCVFLENYHQIVRLSYNKIRQISIFHYNPSSISLAMNNTHFVFRQIGYSFCRKHIFSICLCGETEILVSWGYPSVRPAFHIEAYIQLGDSTQPVVWLINLKGHNPLENI